MQISNKQTKVLTLSTSVSHFINKDLDLEQQYKRADTSTFLNEIVLLDNSDSFQPQIAHTNEDGCYTSRHLVGSQNTAHQGSHTLVWLWTHVEEQHNFFFLEHWILPPGKSRAERIQDHGCYCLTLSSKDSQISLQKEFELFIDRIQLMSLDFDNVIASWDRPGVVAGKMLVIPETQDMGNSLNLSCFLYWSIVVVSFWPFIVLVLTWHLWQSSRNHFVVDEMWLSVQQMFCKLHILWGRCSLNLWTRHLL